MPRYLRIGVDTNTDGVILDPSRSSDEDRGILAWHKAPTTKNPSLGINTAITTMFEQAKIPPDDVASVTIGTTHFVNAVVEMDQSRLAKVAILRLCGPFSKHAPPCIDWPDNLRSLICGHYALLKGGLEVDGDLISDIVEKEILEQCRIIKEKGIASIVVNGIFSPIDTLYQQEERAAEIIKKALPYSDVVLSKEVANLGFLERENAAILNASILPFARKTIKEFQTPIKNLGLKCPLFITQNDGTVLLAKTAARLPIRTFSSGPTNSMRGAAFLVENEAKENLMVVDIGGTTTDVGLLQANGFPRQAAAFSEICGVRVNFSCPDVKSIGLGGGSIVRKNDGMMTVGPDSVGYQIQTKALVFAGTVPTTTDYTVASDINTRIGNPDLVKGLMQEDELVQYKGIVKAMLEKVIDTMKTSPEDLPVLLVGGGAILAPDSLKGASKVMKPKYSSVANAIGAAVARVSAVVDTVESTETKTTALLIEEVSARAIEKAIEGGAARHSVKIVEMDTFPLQYIANKSRVIVRAAGDFDHERVSLDEIEAETDEEATDESVELVVEEDSKKENSQVATQDFDFENYKPLIKGREWIISETDLGWITIGCYILGTGGGGSPYSSMLRLRGIIRDGGVFRVVNPNDLKDDDLVGCGGGAGSPTVGIEKLQGDQMMEAQSELYDLIPKKATHMIALEIGGGNGLQGMILGASTQMDIPTVDGDWMGRAYPVKWQTTPVVFEKNRAVFLPCVMCDGNGNVVSMTKATSDLMVERVFRAGLSQLGSSVGCAEGPVTGAETKRWVVEHTISLSWRIGRAVARARQFNQIDNVAETIVAEVGGEGSAKVLFKGKIVGCDRTLRMGHVYGEVIIEGVDMNEPPNGKTQYRNKMKIPFKNENIVAYHIEADGTEEVVCIVPDLICVIDAQNGEAIGTPEYRYGLLVIVIGIVASEKWTSTPRGIELGGPMGFGMKGVDYVPLGKFSKPKSVIDEYIEQ